MEQNKSFVYSLWDENCLYGKMKERRDNIPGGRKCPMWTGYGPIPTKFRIVRWTLSLVK